MIQIGNSSLTRDLTQISAKVSPRPANGDRGSAQISDQVQLSDAASDISQDRAARIAALTAIVASPDYSPQSTQISRVLISEALSRAA